MANNWDPIVQKFDIAGVGGPKLGYKDINLAISQGFTTSQLEQLNQKARATTGLSVGAQQFFDYDVASKGGKGFGKADVDWLTKTRPGLKGTAIHHGMPDSWVRAIAKKTADHGGMVSGYGQAYTGVWSPTGKNMFEEPKWEMPEWLKSGPPTPYSPGTGSGIKGGGAGGVRRRRSSAATSGAKSGSGKFNRLQISPTVINV